MVCLLALYPDLGLGALEGVSLADLNERLHGSGSVVGQDDLGGSGLVDVDEDVIALSVVVARPHTGWCELASVLALSVEAWISR